jgi:hypothetical protein
MPPLCLACSIAKARQQIMSFISTSLDEEDMPEKIISIWWDEQTKRIAVRFPFDKALVASLKAMIPSAYRSFSKERGNIWLIDLIMEDQLKAIAKGYGYKIESLDTIKENGPSPFHMLLVDLPLPILKKVYRVIATEIHPDRGGSTELMQKVNDAWALIEKEV